MADLFKKIKKIVLGQKDAEELTDSLHDFNKIASSYIGVLQEDVNQKEKKLKRIKVLVAGSLPKDFFKKERGQVNITVMSKKSMKKSKKSSEEGVHSSSSKWDDIESTYNKKFGKSKGFKGGLI